MLPLLVILVFLSLGSSDIFVGCGSGGGGSAGFACISGGDDDPCDYIVTVQVTVLLASDNSPLQGATVTIGSDPPDVINTKVTDEDGRAFWDDTSFITGFSADCSGQTVGTVEPYDPDTSFSHDVLVSAAGLAPLSTVFNIDRDARDIELTVRMQP
jgi:hypothetical protein